MSFVYKFLNQHLELLPQRAIFWHEEKTLLLADLHLGKDGHFRKEGIAVPPVITKNDLIRLGAILDYYEVEKCIFLGDLFHSVYNEQLKWFQNFTQSRPEINYILVRGNHDIIDSEKVAELGIHIITEELIMKPFMFSHHPTKTETLYNICGHLHPAVIIKGKAKQSLKLHVFHFSKKQAILPAFSEFSGTFTMKIKRNDRVFGLIEDEVIEL